MTKRTSRIRSLRVLACGALALALPLAAGASDVGLAKSDPAWPVPAPEATRGVTMNWIDHIDTYATGSQMIGQGGWEGWGGVPTVGALTTDAQARSAPNSIEVVGATDLVHQYAGYTSGTWTFTAWQYIPTGFTGQSYFILLNTYPATVNGNWSFQVCADAAGGVVRDDVGGTCAGAGATLPLIFDQWVEIKAVVDLDTDTQTVTYGGQLLFSGPWSTHISATGGAVNIAAVDLFANTGSSVFYDDISLSNLPFVDGFESGTTVEWHATQAQ